MKKEYAAISVCLILSALSGFCQAEEMSLANLLPLVAFEKSIENTEYLIEALDQRPDVSTFFLNLDHARHWLVSQIKILPHSHAALPCHISAQANSIMDFPLPQLIRVYLILDGLKTGDLLKQIRKILSEYKEDTYYEVGGLGLMKNGKVILSLRPSQLFIKTPDIKAGYSLPDKDFAQPHIFAFHVHPLGNNDPAPGPSWDADLNFAEGKEANINYDIGLAISRAKEHGDSHHLLISKLANGYFNVDYYAAEKIPSPPSRDPFQFCNKLAGFKIVDLGNWK